MIKGQSVVIIFNTTILFLVIFCLAACSDPAINKVKNEPFPGDKLLTWNDFFDAMIIDSSWTTYPHPQGGTKVAVYGDIPIGIRSHVARNCLLLAANIDNISDTSTIGGRLFSNILKLHYSKECYDEIVNDHKTKSRGGFYFKQPDFHRRLLVELLDPSTHNIKNVQKLRILAAEEEVTDYINTIHDHLSLSLKAEFQVASLGLRFEKGMIVIPAGPYAGEYTFLNRDFYNLLQLKHPASN